MKPFPPGTGRRVVARSLLVQGSFNYETLIGTGFAFSILPVLRHLHGADRAAFQAALQRHTEVFNSHPYLANVAIGAVARLEAEGVEPGVIGRFKSALRSSLGSLGDQLIWSAWRPAASLLGLVLFLVGGAWWVAVGTFLLVYNALSFGLRVWGWRVGSALGMDVGRAIRDSPLQALARRATEIGSLLGGAATALAARPAAEDPVAALAAVLAIAAGLWLGLRTRRVMTGVLAIVIVFGLALGIAS